MKPYYRDEAVAICLGDCRSVLPRLKPVDAIVTDPPYGLGFMGQEWDKGVPGVEFWSACLRALKPGGHLVAFGGTRTHHRLWCAIEDAGFEVRDTLMWLYAAGFPKSLDVSKQLDLQERTWWLEIGKALDNLTETAILKVWIAGSGSARSAGVTFRKSRIGTGTSTPRNDSARTPVMASANHDQSRVDAIVAELTTYGAPHLWVAESTPSVPDNVGASTGALSVIVTNARSSPGSLGAKPSTKGSTVPDSVQDLLSGNTAEAIRVAEALKTWHGRKKSSAKADTIALCAALTDALRRTILSRSVTFRALDTTQQMVVASATSVTITESMAASLISSMVATLKRKAIDEAAGAERQIVGTSPSGGYKRLMVTNKEADFRPNDYYPEGNKFTSKVPITDAAKQWEGFGTALRPSWEPILLARKPLEGTVAENVLKHGVGGLNIDATRIGTDHVGWGGGGSTFWSGLKGGDARPIVGRWPANVLLDEEAAAQLDEQSGNRASAGRYNRQKKTGYGFGDDGYGEGGVLTPQYFDTGGASRFFYVAKASRSERERDLKGVAPVSGAEAVNRQEGTAGLQSPRAGAGRTATKVKNPHPTVKPLALMRWLVLLVTPPNGVVLDPFMGSGSTLRAAKDLGRKAIGIEIEERYCEIAAKRMRQTTLGLSL